MKKHVAVVCRNFGHYHNLKTLILGLLTRGHQVSFIYDPRRDKTWKPSFDDIAQYLDNGQFQPQAILPRDDRWRAPLFGSREIRSFASYVNRQATGQVEQSLYYCDRWIRYMPQWAQKFVARGKTYKRLLASPLVVKAMEAIEVAAPPDVRITKALKKLKPDVVLASPMNFAHSEETDYVKAAKALGIPTAVAVISWDNLTSKGLFHVRPDWVLCWNDFHQRDAVALHAINPKRLYVTGSPYFDKWFDVPPVADTREAFLHSIGLDPHYPTMVYLGSSRGIAKDEGHYMAQMIQELRVHPNPKIANMGVLIRPHPIYAMKGQELPAGYQALQGQHQVVIWPDQAQILHDFNTNQYTDFIRSIRFADAVVNVNTTAMIEAMMLGKPGFVILKPEYEATQKGSMHFQNLLDGNVLTCIREFNDLANQLEVLIETGVDPRQADREAFVKRFARPHGVQLPAGAFGAYVLELLANGQLPDSTPEQVTRLAERCLPQSSVPV